LVNKIAAVLFFSGVIAAVSVPFLIDIAKDGELGDSSIKDLVNGLEEFDQDTRWLYLLLLTSLLPFASFPFLQKKTTSILGICVGISNCNGFCIWRNAPSKS